jgi:hypothetical protein
VTSPNVTVDEYRHPPQSRTRCTPDYIVVVAKHKTSATAVTKINFSTTMKEKVDLYLRVFEGSILDLQTGPVKYLFPWVGRSGLPTHMRTSEFDKAINHVWDRHKVQCGDLTIPAARLSATKVRKCLACAVQSKGSAEMKTHFADSLCHSEKTEKAYYDTSIGIRSTEQGTGFIQALYNNTPDCPVTDKSVSSRHSNVEPPSVPSSNVSGL